MAEHLTPAGRAGIIVPEGIIFQSQTAYRDLRKLLVENSLVAVVSLPAGCFNPYSGVKTSILILDKSVARKSSTVGFFKVENDGFGLGAQRRAIEKNDLPQVHVELGAYLQAVRTGASVESLLALTSTAQIVPKARIAANGDYNLSGERYREGGVALSEFRHVTLKEVCEINPDTANPADLYSKSHFNYIDISCVENESGKFLGPNKMVTDEAPSRARRSVKQGDVLMSTVRPNLKAFALLNEVPERAIASTGFAVLRAKLDRLLPGFLINVLRHDRSVVQMIGMAGKGAYPSINQADVESVEIPLPPLEVQREIVAEIEGYQKVINGARVVLDHYRPHIPIHPDWPVVDLGEVIEGKPKNGYSGSPVDYATKLKVLSLSATTLGTMDLSKFKYLDEEIPFDSLCRCRRGDIYLQRGNTKELVGTAAIFDTDDENYIYPDLMIRVRADRSKIRSHYLLTVLQSAPIREFITRNAVGAAGSMPKINQCIVESIPIPLPPLATQQAIVAEIEAEQALVAANRELITRFEQKIQDTLARIWGEGVPVETPSAAISVMLDVAGVSTALATEETAASN